MGSMFYGFGGLGGIVLSVGLFATIVVAMEFGRQVWKWQVDAGREPETTGVGVVASAIFALLGLLIAFTFRGRLRASRRGAP